MSLADIIIELIREMQLNETEIEEIQQALFRIQQEQKDATLEEKKEE